MNEMPNMEKNEYTVLIEQEQDIEPITACYVLTKCCDCFLLLCRLVLLLAILGLAVVIVVTTSKKHH